MELPFLTLFVGASAAMFLVQPAEAAKKALCATYADVAVTLAETSSKCNFSGPMWSRSRSEHFRTCMAATYDEAEKFTDLRFRAVGACIKLAISEADPAKTHPQAPDAETCEKYALTAENQQAENIAKGCGYEGPAWHADRQRHMNWCASVNAEKVDPVINARNEMLHVCDVMLEKAPG